MPKMNRFIGANTTFRRRTPTNEQTAANFTNMVFDHSQQKSVVPSDVVGGCKHSYSTRPMNSDGRPKALRGIDIGGSPDDPGTRK